MFPSSACTSTGLSNQECRPFSKQFLYKKISTLHIYMSWTKIMEYPYIKKLSTEWNTTIKTNIQKLFKNHVYESVSINIYQHDLVLFHIWCRILKSTFCMCICACVCMCMCINLCTCICAGMCICRLVNSYVKWFMYSSRHISSFLTRMLELRGSFGNKLCLVGGSQQTPAIENSKKMTRWMPPATLMNVSLSESSSGCLPLTEWMSECINS